MVKKLKRTIVVPSAVLFLLAAVLGSTASGRSAPKAEGRIFLMMVWDGLRPDLVDARDTPNLFALQHEGVLFANHHAAFPTITMVNAAVLATGADPGRAGILDDSMYFLPEFESNAANLGGLLKSPTDLENSNSLAALNSSEGFDGHLLGAEGVAQQIIRNGGYVAIVGKQGPTFLFDDDANRRTHRSNYMFVADDLAWPQSSAAIAATKPPMELGDLDSIGVRDQWFAKVVISRALPAARAAARTGHPALIVLWQHNPDLVQHIAGLGTQPALNSLHQSDSNLGAIRAAIIKLGIGRRTDLMVVSDHGFATIRMSVALADLLVSAGIKKSSSSADIVVARNGGNDLVYVSPGAYPSEEAQRATLARIVDFAEAQEWCGAIFSKKTASQGSATNRQNRLGWIPGTFAQELLGLHNPRRSPDLIISFREIPELDNRALTGPPNPAFNVGSSGQVARKNASLPLIRPIAGVVYSDSRSLSTGQGMHGAAGLHELHNFCAAAGPDFRRHFVDQAPTANADVAPSIRNILNLRPAAGSSGRVMLEALGHGERKVASARQETLTSYLVLQGQEVITKLNLSHLEGRDYLDDASVTRTTLNGSP